MLDAIIYDSTVTRESGVLTLNDVCELVYEELQLSITRLQASQLMDFLQYEYGDHLQEYFGTLETLSANKEMLAQFCHCLNMYRRQPTTGNMWDSDLARKLKV